MAACKILVIGVIYKTYQHAVEYLESIVRCEEPGLLLVLVDNSEDPAPESFIARVGKSDFVTLIRPGRNLGYLGGASFGYRYAAREMNLKPEWTVVSNVDIRFLDPGFFRNLSRFKADPYTAVLAPSIIESRYKTDLNPYSLSRYSPSRMRFYSFLYRFWLLSNTYVSLSYLLRSVMFAMKLKTDINTREDLRDHFPIYSPHGSCMVFHRNYFDRGGTLDFPSFLFGEEIFIAEEVRKAGLKVSFVPWLKILHLEHSSIGRFLSPRIVKYNKESIDTLIREYYS